MEKNIFFWRINTLQFLGAFLFSLASFSLSISLLRETGSLWSYSINALAVSAVTASLGPISGLLIDKYGRTKTSLFIGIGCLLVGTLCYVDTGDISLLVKALMISVMNAMAMSMLCVVSASTSKFVSDDISEAGRILSSLQTSDQAARTFSPLVLLVFFPVHLEEIALISAFCGGCIVLIALLLRPSFQKIESNNAITKLSDPHVSIKGALRLMVNDPILRIFAPFLAITTSLFEMSALVLNPIFLSFSDEKVLGIIFTCANVSAMAGGYFISKQGGSWSKKYAFNLFIGVELIGALMLVIESQTSSPIVYFSALLFGFFVMPASLVAAQIIWISDTPKERQGLVIGLERFASWLFVPFAYVVPPLLIGDVIQPDEISFLRKVVLIASTLIALACVIAWCCFSFDKEKSEIQKESLKDI